MARRKSNHPADTFVGEMQRRDSAQGAMSEAWDQLSPGQEIRIYRLMAGLSQDRLAKKAGVNKETVVRLERGENVRLDTLNRVKAALSKPKPKKPRDDHEGYTSDDHELVKRYALLDPTAKRALQVLLTRGFTSEMAELLHEWAELDDEERKAIRLMIAGRLSARARRHEA